MAIRGKKFLYFLTDQEGKSFNRERGVVTRSGVPSPLANSPDGWQDKIINYSRNIKWMGAFRSFSIPLRFVTEGKKILRTLFYTYGIEAICNLVILKLNSQTWIHEDLYDGEIDFSKFVDERDTVTANIMEGGLNKLLKANEATMKEMKVETEDAIPVFYDGIDFHSTLNYTTFDYQDYLYNNHTVPITLSSSEGTSFGVIFQSQEYENITGLSYYTSSFNCLVRTTTNPLTFTIKIKVPVKLISSNSGTGFHALYSHIITGSTNTQALVSQHSFTAPGQSFTHDFELTITLPPESKFFIEGRAWATNSGDNIAFQMSYLEEKTTVTFVTRPAESTAYGRTMLSIGKELTSKITDGKHELLSTLLEQNKDLVLHSGDALRGLEGAVIKTNINDFYKACQVLRNGALGIENNKIVIEKLVYFFDNTFELQYLGEVNNFKLLVAEDLMYNTLKIGYQNQTYDNLNGKDEFNTTHIYSSPIKRIVKELDLICPYRADAYGIELTRANLIGKKTTDSGSDNDVFVVQVEEYQYYSNESGLMTFYDTPFGFRLQGDFINSTVTGLKKGVKIRVTGTAFNDKTYTVTNVQPNLTNTDVFVKESTVAETVTGQYYFSKYRPKRGPYDSISGVISPNSIFNVGISPARLVKEHEDYLAMIFDKQTGKLKYETNDKNAELISSIGGVEVVEKADIKISSLKNKLALPYYGTFDTQVSIFIPEIMNNNSRGFFRFTVDGVGYKGFAWDISVKPSDNDVQEWKVLMCPDNDLTPLINR